MTHTAPRPRYVPEVIVVQARYGSRRLLPPTTTAPGGLEQVAGLLVHQAARADTGKASGLLACNLKVTAHDDQDLRALRSELGRLAGQSPVPEVVTQALALVEAHALLSDDGVRALLHAAGLSQGQASTSLVLALAGLYGLTRACDAAELAAVTAVLPALWAQGVIACDVDWTGAQRRELRSRGAVQHEQWLVRSPDHRSKLSFSVRRQLSVQQDAEIGALLQGARRSLAGMPQRHLLPAEDGLEAWVLQQDWLILDLAERVRSRVDLALTAADQVITQALAPRGTVRRAVLVKALEAAGYTEGSAEVAVHRTPYLQAVARGQLSRS